MRRFFMALVIAGVGASGPVLVEAQVLPGTDRWDDRGDTSQAAAAMVDGLHRYLDRALAESVDRRRRHWNRDLSSPESYVKSVEPNRDRLERIIGAVDPRVDPVVLRTIGTSEAPALIAENESIRVFSVRWDVYDDVQAEGLLLEPKAEALANVVAMADCDVPPEQYAGLADGLPIESQVARLLAEAGCRVLVPTLLDRDRTFSGNPDVRMTNLSHREWIWRQAFETGRHPIGYEVDAVRAGVDWFTRNGQPDLPIGVVGHGEGGLIALVSAAIDPRIDAAWVGGYFDRREDVWKEPIARDVFGLLEEFGDAEIASLIMPRALIVEASAGPEVEGPPPVNGRSLAASGRLTSPEPDAVVAEFNRLLAMTEGPLRRSFTLLLPGADAPHNFEDTPRRTFLEALSIPSPDEGETVTAPTWKTVNPLPDPIARMGRWVRALEAHTQALIRTSELRRYEYWSKADTSSLEAWKTSTAPYRDAFWDNVIGRLPAPSEPMSARTIEVLDEPKFTGYAVELPVWPDVVASGVLLLPKDLKKGEKRPVVVCQHGLEGTPDPIVTPGVASPYHSFGARLADLGYIVYAPQNPYIGVDRFRRLQRKAHPLGQSLFALIVRQHERTLEWLKTLPNVDPDRIAFYGLSYGGKTAMRVPALLKDYCLSICSADFNEWVVKCTNLHRPYSYMFTIEYDMYEWDLAGGFNYAEMANLIAPRPFMVERGHSDGVAPDEWIGYEFAKVRRTYDTLGIGDHAAITYFNGGHMIKGEETFDFLARHLDWPRGRE